MRSVIVTLVLAAGVAMVAGTTPTPNISPQTTTPLGNRHALLGGDAQRTGKAAADRPRTRQADRLTHAIFRITDARLLNLIVELAEGMARL